jgi:hypothetical protein
MGLRLKSYDCQVRIEKSKAVEKRWRKVMGLKLATGDLASHDCQTNRKANPLKNGDAK